MTVKTTPIPDNRYPEKPYDRFLYAGPTALSDAELLAIILRTAGRERMPYPLPGRSLIWLLPTGLPD